MIALGYISEYTLIICICFKTYTEFHCQRNFIFSSHFSNTKNDLIRLVPDYHLNVRTNFLHCQIQDFSAHAQIITLRILKNAFFAFHDRDFSKPCTHSNLDRPGSVTGWVVKWFFVWIYCTDVRIHCTDVPIHCTDIPIKCK